MSGVETAGLLLLAGSTLASAGGLYASSKQEKLEKSLNAAETERAMLSGSETALNASKDFRTALSSQLAINSLRGGSGGSLAAQFGAESIANFMSDQRALASQQQFLPIQRDIKNAESSSKRLARDTRTIGSFLKSGSDYINLNEK